MMDHRDQSAEDPLLEAGLSRAYSLETLPPVPRVTESDPVNLGDSKALETFPTTTERFQILGEVARGGMGTVLEVFDRDLGRTVAVKVLHERFRHDENARRRFLTEAQITGQLHHPGIPPIHDLGRGPDGTPSIVMELIRGRTLADILKERSSPTRDQPRLLRIFTDLCRIVAYAHGSGVVHRDIKPLNVMVGHYGEVFLLDWGVARILSKGETQPLPEGPSAVGQATRTGTILGTPGYMPPEQVRGEISRLSPATDVFALGSMLCEILTGQPPVTGKTSDVRKRLATGDLNEGLTLLQACNADPELLSIAERALAPSPEDRFPDAERLHDALTSREELLARQARDTENARIAAESRANAERRLRRFTVAGSVVLLLGVVAALFVWDQVQERQWRLAEQAYQRAATLVLAAEKSSADFRAWDVAVASVDEAVSIHGTGPSFPDLRERLTKLQLRVGAGRENRRLKALFEDVMYGLVAPEQEAEPYFLEVVGDPWGEPNAQIPARMTDRGLASDFAPFLEHWAMRGNKSDEDRAALLALASSLDPDPTRQKIRDAWAHDEPGVVMGIASEIDPAQVEPRTITMLAFNLMDWQRPVLIASESLPRTGTNRGNAALARSLVEGSLQSHPDEVTLHMQMASYWTEFALPPDPAQALTEALAANALRPDLVGASVRLGHALEVLGRYDEAIEWRRRVHEARPDYHSSLYGLAQTLKLAGEFGQAEPLLLQALERAPTDGKAWQLLAEILRTRKDEAGAIDALRRASEHATAPEDFLPYGEVLLQEGDLEAAIAYFEVAISRWPRDPTSHYMLGKTLKQAGRPGAHVAAEHLVAIADHLRTTHGFLDHSPDVYRMAYELRPEMFVVAHTRRVVMIALGRHRDLLEEEALEARRSDRPDAWFQLGFDLALIGEDEEAVHAYRKAWDKEPTGFQHGVFLSGALGDLNRVEEAIGILEDAISVQEDPDFMRPQRSLLERRVRLKNGGQHDGSTGDDIAQAVEAVAVGRPEIAVDIYRRGFAALEGRNPRMPHPLRATEAAVAAAQAAGEAREAFLRQGLSWARMSLEGIRSELRTRRVSGLALLAHLMATKHLAPARERPRTLIMPDDLLAEWLQFWAEADALLQKTVRELD